MLFCKLLGARKEKKMKIKQYEIFDDQVLIARSSLFGDSLSNRKTNPNHSILMLNAHYVEFTILPLWLESHKGKGLLTEIMKSSCSSDCRFLVKALKKEKYKNNKLMCNQTKALNNMIKRVVNFKENPSLNMSFDTNSIKIQSRLTSFGDISRLNKDGLDHIEQIIDSSAYHLAYSAGWRDSKMSRFANKVQASVGYLDEALEAYNLGFMPYGLSKQDNLKFRLLTGEAAYSCPYDTKTIKGCSTCEIRCNGQRAISFK